jgi:hypothetical protein
MKEYRALSLQIVSLSGVAYHSGLISEMNYQILSREFTDLVSVIEKDENKKASEETVILDPGFFQIESSRTDASAGSSMTSESPAISEAISYKGHFISHETKPAPAAAERRNEFFPLKDIREKAHKSSDSKDDRRSIIIKLLTKKSGLGIKDFADSIKGCSEKTIQRELLAMVSSGLLKKEGERRWSTYSLA